MQLTEIEKRYKMNWALSMMERGSIVKLSVRAWSGSTKLDPVDFGIQYVDAEAAKFSQKYINFGKVKLIPPEILRDINGVQVKARQNLYHYSFDTVWGKFIPYTSFHKWEEENDKIKEEFQKNVLEFGRRYEEILQLSKKDFEILGRDVWHRIYPNKGEAPRHFVTNFSTKMIQKIPPKRELMDSFRYNVTFLQIPIPSQFEHEIEKTKKAIRESEENDLKHKKEMEAKLKIQNYYESEMKSNVDDFVESTVDHLRSHVREMCSSILSSIQGKSSMNKSNFVKLRQLVDKIKNVNFFEDTEIDNLFKNLDKEINKPYQYRNLQTINALVSEIHEESIKELDFKEINPIMNSIEI